MKKLFFTAIALVAFSGVSMGNTIEVEYLESIQLIIDSPPLTCDGSKFYAYVDAIRLGATPEEASAFSFEVYFTCKAATAPTFSFN